MKNDKKITKIAIIYAGAKHWGGVETYILNLFKYIDSKEIELHFISIGEWELNKKITNYKLQILNKWSNPKNIKIITNYLKENNIDLIVSQGMVGSFYARLATLNTDIPNIIFVHSDWRYDYGGLKKTIYFISDRILRHKTKHFITVSKYLKQRLISEGIIEEKITSIYNGIDFKIKGKTYINKNHKDIVIGSIGRLHPVKNYKELIKAISLINNPNLKLEIIGDGAQRQELSKLILNLGLKDRVKLLAYKNDIKKYLIKWDIYAQPSITEGFGLTVAEAMLAGKPVIVTPAGSLPELITDGKTGIITNGFDSISIAEGIKRALEDKDFMENAGAKAREEALHRFGIKEWVKKIEKVFLEVAK